MNQIHRSKIYGTVAYINVGAHMVGTIKYNSFRMKDGVPEEDTDEIPPGTEIKKGQDLGYFKFGGSTVICMWEPGAIQRAIFHFSVPLLQLKLLLLLAGRIIFDEDLRTRSHSSTETLVKMGTKLGRSGAKAGQDSAVSLEEINISTIDNKLPPKGTVPAPGQDKPPGCCCTCS